MDGIAERLLGGWVLEIIEGRGSELLYLPPYSPDRNSTEEAFAKLKGLLTAGCGDIDPCTPCICQRSGTLSDEGYARIMLRGSTTLKTAVRRSEARSRQALVEAMGVALDAITARDSRGFFRHCDYYVSVQSL